MLSTERFITQVVASQIKRDDLKERGQCDHLIAPGIPEVWKAMDHDNQWSLAYTGIVDVYCFTSLTVLGSSKIAPLRSAPTKVASVRLIPLRSAPMRLACWRSAE